MPFFTDRAPLEKVRRLSDGRIAAVAKFARAGSYTYAGHELGRPDLPTVTVYRPESEVFDQAAMASFAHKSITLGHPAAAVTADNWKQHSVGWTEGKVARDGEFVEIPLMLADAAAVAAYDAGTRDLSAGYESELQWGAVTTPDGQRADATMRHIRGNHIALVAAGRAGSRCSIGDAKAPEKPASIDAVVKQMITAAASQAGVTPSDYLNSLSPAEQRKLATKASETFLHLTGALTMDAKTIADAQAGREAMHAAVYGDAAPATALDRARIGAQTAVQLAVIDADPRKAWRNDPALESGRAMRDAARFSQY